MCKLWNEKDKSDCYYVSFHYLQEIEHAVKQEIHACILFMRIRA